MFPSVVPLGGAGYLCIPHPFATGIRRFPFDLHVLGTPPAFILSQDQTLNKMFITHIFRCLYSVTRMTHYASLLCFEFSRTNKFCLFVFSFKVFHFQDFRPVNSRPVLHYEVFKVPLCFSATASLLYENAYPRSTLFLIFFKLFLKKICGPEESRKLCYLLIIYTIYGVLHFVPVCTFSVFILTIPARLLSPDG